MPEKMPAITPMRMPPKRGSQPCGGGPTQITEEASAKRAPSPATIIVQTMEIGPWGLNARPKIAPMTAELTAIAKANVVLNG